MADSKDAKGVQAGVPKVFTANDGKVYIEHPRLPGFYGLPGSNVYFRLPERTLKGETKKPQSQSPAASHGCLTGSQSQ